HHQHQAKMRARRLRRPRGAVRGMVHRCHDRRMHRDVDQAHGDSDRKLSVHGSSLVSWRPCDNAACQAMPAAGSYGEPVMGRPPAMRRNRIRAAAAASALVLAGCEQQNTYAPPPPRRVTVTTPVPPVTRYLEATGHTAAVNSANLVARVQGLLQEIKYRDGDLVKQGTVLFVIEPEPYRLKFEQATAAEAKARPSRRGRAFARS